MKQLFLSLTAALVAVLATPALAQPSDSTSASKVPVARRLYDEGVDAVNSGRWSVAHDRFKASYELSPRVLTLFNLAGSQLQTSRFVEASESYRRFLRETADGRYPELRTEATQALENIEKQVAQLKLAVTNVDRADTVTIDDIPFPVSALGEPFPMNPGQHTIAVKRAGAVIATRTVSLSPGTAETITVDVPRRADLQVRPVDGGVNDATLASTAFDDRRDDRDGKSGGGVLRSPWFWTAVVVVVAGSATGAYLLTRPDDNTLVVR